MSILIEFVVQIYFDLIEGFLFVSICFIYPETVRQHHHWPGYVLIGIEHFLGVTPDSYPLDPLEENILFCLWFVAKFQVCWCDLVGQHDIITQGFVSIFLAWITSGIGQHVWKSSFTDISGSRPVASESWDESLGFTQQQQIKRNRTENK